MQIRQRKVPADSGIEMAKMNREAEPPRVRPQAVFLKLCYLCSAPQKGQ